MGPAKTQPALLGGITIGVLSALPVINCCCCAWMLFGGALAAYLMQQSYPGPVQAGDGAIVGLMAGIIGAFVWLVASMVINTAMAPFQSTLVQQILNNSADLPPIFREALEQSRTGGGGTGIGVLFGFFVALVVMTTGGMIGGLFGALLFKKSPPPVVPPPIPQ